MASPLQPVLKRWLFFGFSVSMLVLTGIRLWGSPFTGEAKAPTRESL